MAAVERRAGQSRVVHIALADLDLRHSVISNEAARLVNKMRASLDPNDRAGRADALAQEVQDASGTATKVNDTFARLDPYLLELRVRIWSQIGDLALESCLLRLAAPKQIVVWLRHSIPILRAMQLTLKRLFCSLRPLCGQRTTNSLNRAPSAPRPCPPVKTFWYDRR